MNDDPVGAWVRRPGSVAHVEHLYGLSAEVGHAIFDLTQRLAIAMRASYDCTGVSTRQHNEPDGNQDVWHFHQHLIPRHADDRLYVRHREATWVGAEDRAAYAARLGAVLG